MQKQIPELILSEFSGRDQASALRLDLILTKKKTMWELC